MALPGPEGTLLWIKGRGMDVERQLMQQRWGRSRRKRKKKGKEIDTQPQRN